jgi:hypothetical protein
MVLTDETRPPAAHGLAVRGGIHLAQACAGEQPIVRGHAPVVEVAGHDQRRGGRHLAVDQLAQLHQLALAVRLPQAEVHADGMHFHAFLGCVEHAVQQPALLVAVVRRIVVGVVANGKPRQQRVAVVAVRVHRIAAVGMVGPHGVGQVLVLRLLGPVGVALGMQGVRAQHFLQEDDVRGDRAHGLAQLLQDEAAIEESEALVGIDGQHSKAQGHHLGPLGTRHACPGQRSRGCGACMVRP